MNEKYKYLTDSKMTKLRLQSETACFRSDYKVTDQSNFILLNYYNKVEVCFPAAPVLVSASLLKTTECICIKISHILSQTILWVMILGVKKAKSLQIEERTRNH